MVVLFKNAFFSFALNNKKLKPNILYVFCEFKTIIELIM